MLLQSVFYMLCSDFSPRDSPTFFEMNCCIILLGDKTVWRVLYLFHFWIVCLLLDWASVGSYFCVIVIFSSKLSVFLI